jgi:serine/threonine protein phosphatase PrpC
MTCGPAGGSGAPFDPGMPLPDGPPDGLPAAVPGPLACLACGKPVAVADRFCESCGAELALIRISAGEPGGASRCAYCPAAQMSADGYCETCGRKAAAGRDHQEIDIRLAAGVTDRGLRHARNEDAMALGTTVTAAGPAVVAVLCDGVSSSARADEASLAAVQAAVHPLVAAASSGADLAAASSVAVRAATHAVTTLSGPPGNPPSATFVSAVLAGPAAVVCWLGDSRAYWLAADGGEARQLSADDSVAGQRAAAAQLVTDGQLAADGQLVTDGQAGPDWLAAADAHVVTQWIGADLPDAAPHVRRFELPGPGLLMLCSDGLWNYEPSAAGLAARALPGGLTDPLGTARALVSYALDAGGTDNVTVIMVPFPLGGSGASGSSSLDRPADGPARRENP